MGPSHDYYRAMHGSWWGRLTLSSLGVGWANLGMATTLEYGDPVRHTTRLTWLGLALFRSEEQMVLGEDGRSAEMRGTVWLCGLPAGGYRGAVEVDPDGLGATYRFGMLGVQVVQVTRTPGPGVLDLTQAMGWGRGQVRLLRATAQGQASSERSALSGSPATNTADQPTGAEPLVSPGTRDFAKKATS